MTTVANVTYTLSDLYATGIRGATVRYGPSAQMYDILAQLISGGGDSHGVGGQFTVNDSDLITVLDKHPAVKRTGTTGPPPGPAQPVQGPLTGNFLSPALGDALFVGGDGQVHNIPAGIPGQVLMTNGPAGAPSWASVGLATPVTTINPVAANQVLAAATVGGAFLVTLTQNTTLSISGPVVGTECVIDILLTQDATGGRTVTWPTNITWLGTGVPPTLPAGPSQSLLVTLLSVDGGTTWFGSYSSTQQGSVSPFTSIPMVGGTASRTHTAGTLYVAGIYLPSRAISGFIIQNAGAVAGTAQIFLFDVNGSVVAQTAAVTQAGTNIPQRFPFASRYTPPIGGNYFVGAVFSSATAATYDVLCGSNNGTIAAYTPGAAITPPSTMGTNPLMPTFMSYD